MFIDTPGLADGNLKYKFDVDNVFTWMAAHCDMVLVFFDPLGKALCSKTNQLLKKLFESQIKAEVKFFMTKGDMFGDEADCNKTMVQITSALTQVLPPMHGFEMPIIYVPDEVGNKNKYLP